MTTMPNQNALLTTRELAQLIRISAPTLANWRIQSRGPSFLKVGGRVRYQQADVEQWLEQQRVTTSHPDTEQASLTARTDDVAGENLEETAC